MNNLKKLLLASTLTLMSMGCSSSKEITLHLSFGDRTGKYSGDIENDLPHGQGKFETQNDAGSSWTYEGEFVNGHFEGTGTTTWESGQIETGTYENDVLLPISDEEKKKLFADAASLKNHKVELQGKVFTDPEYTDSLIGIQMFANPEASTDNVIVYIYDPTFEIKTNDYLEITGIIGDVFEGENAFGGTIYVPTVDASDYRKLSYIEAMAPTTKEIEVNKKIDQYGYQVTLQKVEFSEKETRTYFKIENNGTSKFSLYSFNAILSQNGKQYSEQMNYEAGYEQFDNQLLVGNYTEGIIVFPPIQENNFSITLEAFSENWEETIKPFVFEIEVD